MATSDLGRNLNANMSDDDDILPRRNVFVGQTNTCICNFSKVDVSVVVGPRKPARPASSVG